jgi:hypothetical protein
MSFRVRGLPAQPFQPLFGLPDAELARHGAIRMSVDKPVGFPCRIELRDASPGDTVLLLNHEHLPVDTPYRSSHAIFVREGATETVDLRDTVPPALLRRQVALRALDARDMMVAAEVVDGANLQEAIERLLADPAVDYLHAHNAARGCYMARIERG